MKQRNYRIFVSQLSAVKPAARQYKLWLGIALCVLLLVPCGQIGSAWGAAYHGQVVDAETGKPIEGAVVFVVWHKKAFLSMNGGWSFHNARETLTDAEGKFSLSSAEGINLNPFTFVQEPRIRVFSPGYLPLSPEHPGEFKHVYGIAEALERGAVVKLSKLKTIEEMRKFATCASCVGISADIPVEKVIPNVLRLINVHRKMLGLNPFQ